MTGRLKAEEKRIEQSVAVERKTQCWRLRKEGGGLGGGNFGASRKKVLGRAGVRQNPGV
jgi:hypothetical protein